MIRRPGNSLESRGIPFGTLVSLRYLGRGLSAFPEQAGFPFLQKLHVTRYLLWMAVTFHSAVGSCSIGRAPDILRNLHQTAVITTHNFGNQGIAQIS